MPTLVVIFGRDRGRHFTITPGAKLVIGRSKSLIHRLNDVSISRQHLEFEHQAHDNKCFVHDMQSRNGAWINEKKLFHIQEITDGDVIQVGYTLLVYVRITFDADMSVKEFLDKCEDVYHEQLQRIRDHAAMHVDKEDQGYDSAGSMSGTLHLGNIFKRKGK